MFVAATQSGDELCQIRCNTSTSILQLKAKVEVEAGVKAATLAIYLAEVTQPLRQNVTLADCGLPATLYAVTLHKIVIAVMVGVSPEQLTDGQLVEASLTDEGKAGDIVGLAGCTTIRDVSCLIRLEQMRELDISGCMGIDATTVAKVVAENRTLSKLIFGGDYDEAREETPEPAILGVDMTEADFGNKNLGVGGAIIISAWLTHKDKGAMTSLNLSDNDLKAEGAKHVAGAIKVTVCHCSCFGPSSACSYGHWLAQL
jgi:hypothetical protein